MNSHTRICPSCQAEFVRTRVGRGYQKYCADCGSQRRIHRDRQLRSCAGGCGSTQYRKAEVFWCHACTHGRKLARRRISQKERRQQRPGYRPQLERQASADRGREKEFVRHYAKRMGVTVEEWLALKVASPNKRVQNPNKVRRQRQQSDALRQARDTAKAARLAALEVRKLDEIAKHPWRDPLLTQGERWRMQYRLDPEFKLKESLRAQLKKKRKGRAGNWAYCLRRAIVGDGPRPRSIEAFLGFTIAALRLHIERQFTKGMDWQTFMTGAIHIDHIRPLSSFDMTNDADVRAAWAITNLRPMWAADNIKKGAKVLLLV